MAFDVEMLLQRLSGHRQPFPEEEQGILFREGIPLKGIGRLRPEHPEGKENVLAQVSVQTVKPEKT